MDAFVVGYVSKELHSRLDKKGFSEKYNNIDLFG